MSSPPPVIAPDPRERLREFALAGADIAHFRGYDAGNISGHTEASPSRCPHPDCVLVRASFPAPPDVVCPKHQKPMWANYSVCPAYVKVRPMLESLLEKQHELEPMAFYTEFELIHPFVDGNGRTGKILLNWLNRTLDAPIFPPNDLFGHPIQNP